MKSSSTSLISRESEVYSPERTKGLVSLWADLFHVSVRLVRGGMDCFSSASSLARIFVSTVAVRVAGSGCVTVAEGEAGNGTCAGLLTSVPVFSVVGSAGVLFLGRGVGGSSSTTIGWEFGVAACYVLTPLVLFPDCRLITILLSRSIVCPIPNSEALHPGNSVTVSSRSDTHPV